MNIKNIKIGIFLLLTIVGLSGCKDNMMSEITELNVDRAFSPTGLTATVINKIDVKLTWKSVVNANSYTAEIFVNADFSGTPVKTVNNITYTQVPYTVAGLGGDTQYYVRVKALGDGIPDSKWITAAFKTDAEQIFNAVKLTDIGAKSVVLTWPVGQVATTITLTPGNITHAVTSAEIAVGSATITGLVGETNYTAKLLNGNSTRGTITFKTAVDIGDAILINSLAEFNTALGKAVGGEAYALVAGDYDFTGATTVSITKSISIVAVKATERPVLKNVTFNVQSGASLKLKNLIMDGGGTTINYAVSYAIGNFGDFEMDGSIVRNYGAGVVGITSALTTVSSILINNSVFSTFGTNGEFIDFRTGFANKFTFSNNTLYGTGDREFIRMDAAAGAVYPASKVIITVNNNTFYGLGGGVSKRLFYVRIPLASNEITFSKNIVTNTAILLANQAATNFVTLSGNNYFATTNLISSTASGAKVDASGTALDPGFVGPATANFKLSNQTLISNGIGDPRWK